MLQVANGTTDKAGPRCRKLLHAGAVRIKWPADSDYQEKESYSWHVLEEHRWRAQKRLGWRFSVSELKKQAGLRQAGKQ